MSLFEFVLTGFTLVLALVITRILSGLRWVLAQGRVYWVHAAFVIAILVLTSLVWWGLWYQRDNEWTYLSFAYNLLIGPGIMFFLAAVLVPEIPRRVRDWRAYYFSVRRLMFGTLVGFVVAVFAGSVLITGTPLWHPSQLVLGVAFILSLCGYLTAREVVHGVLAVVMLLLVTCSIVLAAISPNV
ncbi:MAG: hypothetical protein AAF513_11720 [Pseudomonadota bacterium]